VIYIFSQSVSIENNFHEESEQQIISIEPVIVSKKQVLTSSNVAIIKENTSDDNRSNRKSMFEPIITRRISPPIAPTNTHVMERVSLINSIDLNSFLFIGFYTSIKSWQSKSYQ
jgi:hypothetical protein